MFLHSAVPWEENYQHTVMTLSLSPSLSNSIENGRLVIRDLGNNFINHKFSNSWNQVFNLAEYCDLQKIFWKVMY